MDKQYYDGTKLLSLKDINGKQPEIYISTSNRSAGKTTFFSRWFINRFIKYDEKFILIYRFNYELSDVADKFFKEIKNLFFPGYNMKSVSRNKNVYHELFLNDKACGYAIAINNSDQIKKLSHLFSDAKRMLFDEFQSETGHYCSNEVEKFLSIHTSIARGDGEQVKYLPVYMLGNFVSLLNPYYTALNVSHKIQESTKYLRGDGFVIEQGFYDNVAEQQKNSAFNRAFAGSSYTKFASEKIYLNDNKTFIAKPTGNNRYIITIKQNGNFYGLREYFDEHIIYCSKSYDETFKTVICTDVNDHDINYLMLKNNDLFLQTLRNYFEFGCLRFQNLECKEVIFNLLKYT